MSFFIDQKLGIAMLKQVFWDLLLSHHDNYLSKKLNFLSQRSEELIWKQRLQSAGVPNANRIPTYTSLNELRTLYTLASQCPKNSLSIEIGSYLGASSCYIAAGLTHINGSLVCIDTWENETMPEGEKNTFQEFQKNTLGVSQQIITIRKRSEEINQNDLNNLVDFVFIDGDHSYEAVKADFELVQNWLAEDGIIAFHDFSNSDYEGVSRVVGEAIASGEWLLLGKVETLAWVKRVQWQKPTWLSEK